MSTPQSEMLAPALRPLFDKILTTRKDANLYISLNKHNSTTSIERAKEDLKCIERAKSDLLYTSKMHREQKEKGYTIFLSNIDAPFEKLVTILQRMASHSSEADSYKSNGMLVNEVKIHKIITLFECQNDTCFHNENNDIDCNALILEYGFPNIQKEISGEN